MGRLIEIPNGSTNGDIIKAMFPNCKDWKATYAGEEIHLVQLPDSLRINEYLERWWNAPYKRGSENANEQAIEYIDSIMQEYDRPKEVDKFDSGYRLCEIWLSKQDIRALELAKETLRGKKDET